MSFEKWLTLAIYCALALSATVFPQSVIAHVTVWFFALLPIAHLFEFLAVRQLFAQDARPKHHHFLQTLLFGYVHWLPIKKKQRPDDNRVQ